MEMVFFGLGGWSCLFVLTVYVIYFVLGACSMAHAWTLEDTL